MTYPAKIPGMRRSLARRDICPECGGALDTGWKCNACGYDAKSEATTTAYRERNERVAEPLRTIVNSFSAISKADRA